MQGLCKVFTRLSEAFQKSFRRRLQVVWKASRRFLGSVQEMFKLHSCADYRVLGQVRRLLQSVIRMLQGFQKGV